MISFFKSQRQNKIASANLKLRTGLLLLGSFAVLAAPSGFAANMKPVANAGADQSVYTSAQVQLAGSGTDPDGQIMSYKWVQTAGTKVSNLQHTDTATPSFTTPAKHTNVTFKLTVTDNASATGTDTVTVRVYAGNIPPVAIGKDVYIEAKTQTMGTLDASESNDAEDGTRLNYLWKQTSGPKVILSDVTSSTPTFDSTPAVKAQKLGKLTFSLTVTDSGGLKAKDTVTVWVDPGDLPPKANAGPDQSINEQSYFTLNGSASKVYPNSQGTSPLSYVWEKTGGTLTITPVDLSDPVKPKYYAPRVDKTSFVTYKLTVTDKKGNSSSDTLKITVKFSTKLNDTGIRTDQCYQDNGLMNEELLFGDCASTNPVVYANQDGLTGRDSKPQFNDSSDGHLGFSFIKIDSSGKELDATAEDWDCVKDKITGLMWEVKNKNKGDLRDYTKVYTNYSSSYDPNKLYKKPTDAQGFVADVNKLGLCGYKNWRLPTVTELQSLIDYSVDTSTTTPPIDNAYFPYTLEGTYWSSTTAPAAIKNAWYISFDSGVADNGTKDNLLRDTTYAVRLVRTAL